MMLIYFNVLITRLQIKGCKKLFVLLQRNLFCFINLLTRRKSKTNLCFFFSATVNPIKDRLFRDFSRLREPKKPPFSKICHTYPTIMKAGTVIHYLRKIQKTYKSFDIPWSSVDIRNFSPEIENFCCVKKYKYRLHFNT